MTSRNLFAGAFASVFTLLVQSAFASPITYAVALFDDQFAFGGGTVGVGGSITTDGTLGPLAAADILDWNLIAVASVSPCPPCAVIFNLTGPLSGGNSNIDGLEGVTATPLTLELVNPSFISALVFTDGNNVVLFRWLPVAFDLPTFLVISGNIGNTGVIQPLGSSVFADGKDVPSTPLPAALPLFATGLGALGLLGWRRRRNASVQSVARG